MTLTYSQLALTRLRRAFGRTFRAYFDRPSVLTAAHDDQLYWLARSLGHEGRILLGEQR